MSMTMEQFIAPYNWEDSHANKQEEYRDLAERRFWRAHSRGKWRARILRLHKSEDRLVDEAEVTLWEM